MAVGGGRGILAALVAAGLSGCGGTGETDPGPPPCGGILVAAPAWALEGDPIRIAIACANGDPLPQDVSLQGLPADARLEPGGVVRWTPGLGDAGSYELSVLVAGRRFASVSVGVVDRWDARGNVPPDPSRYLEEYGLPVFHLEVAGPLSDLAYAPATLTYRGKRYAVEVKYRGSRSLSYPKKSFTIAFPDSSRFSDPALGFSGRKKVLLVTTFDDQTGLRDRLGLELWRRLDPANVGVNTAHAVLYLGGDYRGLYLMSEKLGGQVLAAAGLDGDGNLYQAKTHLANFYGVSPTGEPKQTWHDGYEKDEGTPPEGMPGAFDDLDAFVRFVATSDDATFASRLPRLAAVDEYRDWWTLAMLAACADCSRKNNFQYHDPLGGPWQTMAWDYGSSFGQDFNTLRVPAEAPGTFAPDNNLFRRLLLAPFAAGTRARLASALRERVPVADVLARVDQLARETREVARRDEERWNPEHRAFFGAQGRTEFGTYDDELGYLRRWIAQRWAYLDGP